MNLIRPFQILVCITAWMLPWSALAFGPGDPPPGVSDFSGGPVALDVFHDRIFLCDSSNNRILVYNFTGADGFLGPQPVAVIGQANATSVGLNAFGTIEANGCGLAHPEGIAYDPKRNGLWVSDFLNNRVLFFSTRDLRNLQPAEYVLGQTDFGYTDARTGKRGLSGPSGLALSSDSQQLFVADKFNNRVLVYDISEPRNHLPAAAVIGQTDFWKKGPGTSESTMYSPTAIVIDFAGQVYISDTGNNRVLIFDSSLPVTGAAALAVLGQRDFTSADTGVGVNGMSGPTALAVDLVGQWLFVSDTGNHRVLAFDGQSQNNLCASAVIGQPDVDSHSPQPSNSGLDDPVGLAFDIVEKKLWVSETGNARVGFYKLGD